MSYTVLALLVTAASALGLTWAAARFGRQRRAEGAWDENGPLHPTEPPLDHLQPRAQSQAMRDLLAGRMRLDGREPLLEIPETDVEGDGEEQETGAEDESDINNRDRGPAA